MKPYSQYFTVDLNRRPFSVSKRAALLRSFEVAARDVVDAALKEGGVPNEVLVMVTLAPKSGVLEPPAPPGGKEPT